jgi:DHA1 family bicyclomycin/chloramphenicol resistance-like MFS transporter
MPFLHANLPHIVSNTPPLFILLVLLAGSRANSWAVVVAVILLGGALLWLVGRPAIHIGASGLIFGALLGYLSSAQQILQQLYSLGSRFPLFFAMVAIAIGAASLANASLVLRYGMRTLATWSLRGIFVVSIVFGAIATMWSGQPPLWGLMMYLMASFFGIGVLFGNLNALAMQPLGHIAGTGAAIVGATSMLISLVLGTLIGQSYNGTVLPLVIGFGALSASAMLVSWWAESGARQPDPTPLAAAETPTGEIG